MATPNLKELGQQVHKLKPVVIIGNKGLTEAVQSEISQALDHHELIKIKIAGGEKEFREQVIQDVCVTQKAKLVKKIGHTFAIYRKRPEQK